MNSCDRIRLRILFRLVSKPKMVRKKSRISFYTAGLSPILKRSKRYPTGLENTAIQNKNYRNTSGQSSNTSNLNVPLGLASYHQMKNPPSLPKPPTLPPPRPPQKNASVQT